MEDTAVKSTADENFLSKQFFKRIWVPTSRPAFLRSHRLHYDWLHHRDLFNFYLLLLQPVGDCINAGLWNRSLSWRNRCRPNKDSGVKQLYPRWKSYFAWHLKSLSRFECIKTVGLGWEGILFRVVLVLQPSLISIGIEFNTCENKALRWTMHNLIYIFWMRFSASLSFGLLFSATENIPFLVAANRIIWAEAKYWLNKEDVAYLLYQLSLQKRTKLKGFGEMVSGCLHEKCLFWSCNGYRSAPQKSLERCHSLQQEQGLRD